MKLRLTGLISTVAAATLLFGCAAGSGRSGSFSENPADNEVKIFITNLAFMDATVSAYIFGGQHRLGRVTGKKEAVFTLNIPAPSEMYLEIDLLAGPTCETERMMVDPGDHLELIIQNDYAGWMCRAS